MGGSFRRWQPWKVKGTKDNDVIENDLLELEMINNLEVSVPT